jgi:hypothetical protein
MPIILIALVCVGGTLRADVKTQEKSQFKLGGALGKVVGMFGGKAAREGVVSTVALKGDRRAKTTDRHEEIVDLAEEKVYTIDLDDKSYTVATFAELRKKMEDAQKEAQERAQRQKPEEKADKAPADKTGEKQVEVDFDLKETGEKKAINGYDTRQVIMTITVREKGKTLDEAGGTVLTADTWLAPEIPEMKEVAQFELRYAQKLYGGLLTTESMQQMAAAMAANPGLKDAMARFQKEKVNLKGTAISTIVTLDGVKSAPQMAEDARRGEGSDDSSSGGGGGLIGGFARRMAKHKSEDKPAAAAQPPNRATVLTLTNDVLKVEPSASAADVAVPAGFKQK